MEWKNAYLIDKTHDYLTFKRDLEGITIKEYFGGGHHPLQRLLLTLLL